MNMKRLYKILDIIFTPILYVGVLYLLSSTIKYLYLLTTNSLFSERIIVFNHFYLYEIVIIVISFVIIHKHVKVETAFKKYLVKK